MSDVYCSSRASRQYLSCIPHRNTSLMRDACTCEHTRTSQQKEKEGEEEHSSLCFKGMVQMWNFMWPWHVNIWSTIDRCIRSHCSRWAESGDRMPEVHLKCEDVAPTQSIVTYTARLVTSMRSQLNFFQFSNLTSEIEEGFHLNFEKTCNQSSPDFRSRFLLIALSLSISELPAVSMATSTRIMAIIIYLLVHWARIQSTLLIFSSSVWRA